MKKLLPQHIPNGQKIPEEALQNVNEILSNLPKKALIRAIVIIAVYIGFILFSKFLIGGAIGSVFMVIALIFSPLIVALSFIGSPQKKLNEELENIGYRYNIGKEDWKIALQNRQKNFFEWGVDQNDEK